MEAQIWAKITWIHINKRTSINYSYFYLNGHTFIWHHYWSSSLSFWQDFKDSSLETGIRNVKWKQILILTFEVATASAAGLWCSLHLIKLVVKNLALIRRIWLICHELNLKLLILRTIRLKSEALRFQG